MNDGSLTNPARKIYDLHHVVPHNGWYCGSSDFKQIGVTETQFIVQYGDHAGSDARKYQAGPRWRSICIDELSQLCEMKQQQVGYMFRLVGIMDKGGIACH